MAPSRPSFILLFCFCSLAWVLRPVAAQVYSDCLRNATGNDAGTLADSLTWALQELTDLAAAGSKYAVASANSGSRCVSVSQNLSSYGPSCDSSSISASTVADTAYAMFQCRGDQSVEGCSNCLANATGTLSHSLCPSSVGAYIQLDGCYVRYDNQTFFTPDFHLVRKLCSPDITGDPIALAAIDALVSNVSAQAPKHQGYASASASNEYALAQCLGFLNETECLGCLTSYGYRQACDMALGGQIHMASCYYRFEPYKFFTAYVPLSVVPSSSTRGSKVKIIAVCVVIGGILCTAVYYKCWYRRKNKSVQGMDAL